MKHFALFKFVRLVPHVVIAGALLALPACCLANGPASPITVAGLKKVVKLRLGPTTMRAAAAALSEQTGLKIVPAAYLAERNMTIQMSSLPASAVLNALCRLNDWEWAETEVGHILVKRRMARIPSKLSDLPAAMQSTVPRDVRDYFMIGSKEPLGSRGHALNDEQIRIASGNQGSRVFAPFVMQAILQAEDTRAVEMMESLAPHQGEKDRAVAESRRFAYRVMLPAEKQRLLEMLMLCSLRRAINVTSNLAEARLLYGELQPYQLDARMIELSPHKGALMLGATKEFTTTDGRTGTVWEGFPIP